MSFASILRQLDDSHPRGEHADEFDSSQHSTSMYLI